MPKADDINLNGLEKEVSVEDMRELLSVDVAGWKTEMESIKELYSHFGDKLPQELTNQPCALKSALTSKAKKSASLSGIKTCCFSKPNMRDYRKDVDFIFLLISFLGRDLLSNFKFLLNKVLLGFGLFEF